MFEIKIIVAVITSVVCFSAGWYAADVFDTARDNAERQLQQDKINEDQRLVNKITTRNTEIVSDVAQRAAKQKNDIERVRSDNRNILIGMRDAPQTTVFADDTACEATCRVAVERADQRFDECANALVEVAERADNLAVERNQLAESWSTLTTSQRSD